MIESNYVNKISKAVFIPPRKRQSVKKLNGSTQNYVDHVLPASAIGVSHVTYFLSWEKNIRVLSGLKKFLIIFFLFNKREQQ